MTIKTQVSFRQYVRLLFGLTYQRPVLKLLLGVAVMLILWIVFYYTGILDLPKPIIYQYITLALILVAQPIVIFTTIYTVYHSSFQICEPLEMQLLSDEIKIRGNSFYMEVKWEKLFKIIEKRDWFLIYQNSLSAIIIAKKDMEHTEITEFRKILQDLEKVPVQLMDQI